MCHLPNSLGVATNRPRLFRRKDAGGGLDSIVSFGIPPWSGIAIAAYFAWQCQTLSKSVCLATDRARPWGEHC